MKVHYLSLLLAFAVSACAFTQKTSTPISQDDVLNTAVAAVIRTQTAEVSTLPTEAIVPSPIVAPTNTETPGIIYAWNYLATQNSGGVEITIGRILIAEKTAIDLDFSALDIFNDKPVIAEVIFIVDNKTSSIVSVYPDQGKVLAGSEQIELFNFAIAGANLDEAQYSGDVLPGAKLIGGLWFGLQRTSLAEINSMTVFISAPFAKDSFQQLGPDFNFNLDLSQKQFSPIPDELK